MAEDFFETQYDTTIRSRIKKFYKSNKIFIFSSILILIIFNCLFKSLFRKQRKENDFIIRKLYTSKILS